MSKQAVKSVQKKRSVLMVDTLGQAHMPEMDRQEMIALEAYLRAEQRGFEGGDPLDDWLEAESYIDSK